MSITVGEQIEALERVAGPEAAALIVESPDSARGRDRRGAAVAFRHRPRHRLGFKADATYDDIIRAYIEDDSR